jgi:hypothetical protein
VSKLIKSNIEARQASLINGSNQVSLFHEELLTCNALYLSQNQEHNFSTKNSESVVLSVFHGTGELRYQNQTTNQTLNLQIMQGDILSLAPNTSYTITNLSNKLLMISELVIRL